MWTHAIASLEQGDNLLKSHLGNAFRAIRQGYQELDRALMEWRAYHQQTIAGAEGIATGLAVVRDAAIVAEVALLTGGLAAGAMGGSATVVGASAGAGVAAVLPSTRDTVRGTLAEIIDAGIIENLRYAGWGLCGLMRGLGSGLEDMLIGLVELFIDPIQFADDLIRLPQYLEQLFSNREALWQAFAALPPETQAQQIGEFTGHIEAMLVALKTSQAMAETLRTAAFDIPIALAPAHELAFATAAVQLEGLAAIPEIAAAAGALNHARVPPDQVRVAKSTGYYVDKDGEVQKVPRGWSPPKALEVEEVVAKPTTGPRKPPDVPSGFPGLVEVKAKTTVRGGGMRRKRWKDKKGNIYEWDYQHGTVEKYNKRGRHLGEFDSDTGAMTKEPVKGRKVDP